MPSQQRIPILNRTLRLLEAVTLRGRASAKQLSIDLGIPPATCYRILNTLADAHWLLRDSLGDYRLSFGISRLGGLAADLARFFAVSHPVLRELTEATGVSSKISVREGDDWLILARFEQPDATAIFKLAGSRDCIVMGSVGAVLVYRLADEEIRQILREHPGTVKSEAAIFDRVACCREHGYATDFGATNPNIHAVSIPMSLPFEEESGAITLFGFPYRLSPSKLETTLLKLRQAAERIQEALQK